MKRIKLLIVCSIILVGIVWWLAPVTFLKNVSASEVASIEVIGGDTGRGFTIIDPEDIDFIVENIKGIPVKKKKISLMYSGGYFNLTFKDRNGKNINHLSVNGPDTIRKDPFFYYDDTASLCVDFLEEVEGNMNKDNTSTSQKMGDEKADLEIWKEFLLDYKEALRIVYLSLDINTDSYDENGFLVTDKYNSIEQLKAVINAVFTPTFIEETLSAEINPRVHLFVSLFDGEDPFYSEKGGRLYLQAADGPHSLFKVGSLKPNSIEQNDSEITVTFDDIDDGFGKKLSIIFTLSMDDAGTWKLDKYEEVESESLINIDGRSFELEDIPENVAEETIKLINIIFNEIDSEFSKSI